MKRASLTSLLLMLANCDRADPASPLVAGLESLAADDAKRELDQRLARRFAPGTPEAALIGALRAEGFEVAEEAARCEGPRCASIERWPDRLGGLAWSVRWATDQNGRVTSVRSRVTLLN